MILLLFLLGLLTRVHGTRIRSNCLAMSTSNRPLIIGLNKYSHDASCCVVDASTGKILYAQAKERITRRKHDGGATGSLLSYALEYVGATLDDIAVVVSNNHHYRLHPFERRAPFAAALGYVQKDILDPMNLVPGAKHYELVSDCIPRLQMSQMPLSHIH